jgi:hypothetical protein
MSCLESRSISLVSVKDRIGSGFRAQAFGLPRNDGCGQGGSIRKYFCATLPGQPAKTPGIARAHAPEILVFTDS